jgi:hypothetical protein
MKLVEITDSLAPHFEAINRQWISKYFKIAPIDEEVLSNGAVYKWGWSFKLFSYSSPEIASPKQLSTMRPLHCTTNN